MQTDKKLKKIKNSGKKKEENDHNCSIHLQLQHKNHFFLKIKKVMKLDDAFMI